MPDEDHRYPSQRSVTVAALLVFSTRRIIARLLRRRDPAT
jgi:hypothetical protein